MLRRRAERLAALVRLRGSPFKAEEWVELARAGLLSQVRHTIAPGDGVKCLGGGSG